MSPRRVISEDEKKKKPEPLEGRQRDFWLEFAERNFRNSQKWKDLRGKHPFKGDNESDHDWEWRLIYHGLYPESKEDPNPRKSRHCIGNTKSVDDFETDHTHYPGNAYWIPRRKAVQYEAS